MVIGDLDSESKAQPSNVELQGQAPSASNESTPSDAVIEEDRPASPVAPWGGGVHLPRRAGRKAKGPGKRSQPVPRTSRDGEQV